MVSNQRKVNMKKLFTIMVAVNGMVALGDVLVIENTPSVVRQAEIREAIRQDSTWTFCKEN